MAPVQLLVQLHTLGATHDPPFSQGGVQTATYMELQWHYMYYDDDVYGTVEPV